MVMKCISDKCLNILARIKMNTEICDGHNKIIIFFILDKNSLGTVGIWATSH